MSRIKDSRSDKKFFQSRLAIALMIIFALATLLLSRLFYLQIIQHGHYTTLSNKNSINLIPVPPRRGLIYDRNGLLLAKNIPVFSLMITPDQVPDLKKTLIALQKVLPISTNEMATFKRQLNQHRPSDPIPLKIKLTKKDVAAFEVNQFQFPGVNVQAQLTRYYPYGNLFAHAIGYVGRINDHDLKQIDIANYDGTNFIGKTGIEKYYENTLHGKVGYKRIEVDSAGHGIRTLSTIPATPGKNLYLSLDKGLQDASMQALKGQRGAVVVINPNNGAVLTMVSSPSFNPNLFVNGISNKEYSELLNNPDRPLYNRTIRGEYASGSTIKPFFALQGLLTNTITPDYTINDRGIYHIPGNSHIFHDWKRGGHGQVNVTKAIMESCDTYFYNLAHMMGIKNMDQILTAFGFGQATGIDLPNELSGVSPTPAWKEKAKGEMWYPGDSINLGIGQGYLLVTPLQLANATAALSVRGQLFRPYLLKSSTPVKLNAIDAPQKDWDIVLNAMDRVISQEGTAWRFGTPKNYTAAGKTGTAQVSSIRFSEDYTHVPVHLRPDSWIIVFAPTDHPQIAMAVLVENNPGGSAPVARKVADYYFSHPQDFSN